MQTSSARQDYHQLISPEAESEREEYREVWRGKLKEREVWKESWLGMWGESRLTGGVDFISVSSLHIRV